MINHFIGEIFLEQKPFHLMLKNFQQELIQNNYDYLLVQYKQLLNHLIPTKINMLLKNYNKNNKSLSNLEMIKF